MTCPFLGRSSAGVTQEGGACDFAENSVIKSPFMRAQNGVTAKPGVTLQPCCAHITRSSVSGTQMQNGRQMLFILFSASCELS